jgi:hypothetical protein
MCGNIVQAQTLDCKLQAIKKQREAENFRVGIKNKNNIRYGTK